MQFVFTNYARRQWLNFSPDVQIDLERKLSALRDAPELLSKRIRKIHNIDPATHRLRVGNYRLLIEFDGQTQQYLVLKIAHRKDIYR
jgi:mRNA-degrading endonuclease RelE of RelBE toxin-antitoxin system